MFYSLGKEVCTSDENIPIKARVVGDKIRVWSDWVWKAIIR